MNSLPLSESRPRKGKGSLCPTRCTAPPTLSWPLPHTGWHSTHPVATSTAVNVLRYKPSVLSPQWATRSTSRNPGRSSFHSLKVRIGIDAFSRLPGLVVLKGRRVPRCLWGRKSRSIVDALSWHSCLATWGVTLSSPLFWRTSVSSGKKGWSRLLQRRSAAEVSSKSV